MGMTLSTDFHNRRIFPRDRDTARICLPGRIRHQFARNRVYRSNPCHISSRTSGQAVDMTPSNDFHTLRRTRDLRCIFRTCLPARTRRGSGQIRAYKNSPHCTLGCRLYLCRGMIRGMDCHIPSRIHCHLGTCCSGRP